MCPKENKQLIRYKQKAVEKEQQNAMSNQKKYVLKLFQIHLVSLCVCVINKYLRSNIFLFYVLRTHIKLFSVFLLRGNGRGCAIYRYMRIICIKLEMISLRVWIYVRYIGGYERKSQHAADAHTHTTHTRTAKHT